MLNLSTIELQDKDSKNNRQIPVQIMFENGCLFLRPEGTGDLHSPDGEGFPIMLEYYNKSIRLVVWADINQEDPTHIIPLENALESNRK
jgi:hypothetical protein